MKNVTKLLAASAAINIFSGVALADAPNVKMGGKVDFQAGFVSQKDTYKTANTKFDRTQHFAHETRLKVVADGMTDCGMKYGSTIEFGDKSRSLASTSGKDVELKDTFMFLESNFGRFELGSMSPVTRKLNLDASTIARGAGGAAGGDYKYYVNSSFGFIPTSTAGTNISGVWLTDPKLPLDLSTYYAKYNKISFYTPEVNGLQMGLSFGVDTGEVGSSNAISSRYLDTSASPIPFTTRHFKNAFSGALKYKAHTDQLAFEVTATGQYAKAERKSSTATIDQEIQNVKAYAFGGSVKYTDFTLLANMGNWGKSMNTKETDAYSRSSTRYYSFGGAYTHGSLGMSVTYFDSKRMKNKLNAWAVGADYTLAPGLQPYAEGTFFKFKPATGVTTTSGGATQSAKNSGSVVFVGTRFSF